VQDRRQVHNRCKCRKCRAWICQSVANFASLPSGLCPG
jgi:hypothetical protein